MYKRSDGCHYLRLQSQTRDSNPEPSAYKAVALPIAPAWHFTISDFGGNRTLILRETTESTSHYTTKPKCVIRVARHPGDVGIATTEAKRRCEPWTFGLRVRCSAS